MRLIESIQIEGFRSIQATTLNNLSAFTTLVGKNSSGKSNLLRALSLFFNNEPEPGKALLFGRDAYDEVPSPKKKKKILVAVTFDVPSNFKFRPGLEGVLGLGPRFTIEREWQLDPRRQVIESTTLMVNGAPVSHGDTLARQFMGLIRFRYIPNRTVPAQLLRDESQTVANATFRRMRGSDQGADLIRLMEEAARKLLNEASQSFTDSGSPLVQPSIATAKSISQMVQMSGFQAKGRHGGTVHDEEWGAGHQALFLYELLQTIDTDISQSYGWRQAAIWGVEEPESGLHHDLETRLGTEFRGWALSTNSRLQVFQTTHSPVFTMAAESGFWVELDGKRSKFEALTVPELTRAAEVRGVSAWVHPVLSFPWSPVVLVEGPTDAEALSHVAGLAKLTQLRFVSLPNFDPAERGGGKDSIVKYLKSYGALISNRPTDAPLLVLLDWDISDQELIKARDAYGAEAELLVQRMDASHCSPRLGNSFRGIERFYPSRLIKEAHDAGELIVGMTTNEDHYSVELTQLNQGKGRLLQRLLRVTDITELDALHETVKNLDRIARSQSAAQPQLPGMT